MKLHFVLNEPGSGEVAIPMADPAADDVASGKVVRVAYRGQYRGAFFVEDIGEKRVTSGDYTGQVKTVRGRGAMAVLDRATVWHANQGESTREFSSQPAAEMFVTLVEEAQARGGLSSLELTFNDTYDSDNNAWSDTRTLDFRVGTSLLDVMRKIAGLGIDFSMEFDWSRNVYYLNAYRDGRGSDKSSSIVFREGKNCTEVGNSEKSQELGNVVLVEYGDGQYVSVSNATSISEYGRREIFLSAGQAGSSSEATAYGNAELDERKDPETSITVVVTDSEVPMAFVDYEVGDWVGYAKYDDESPTSYRIRGMTLSWGQNQRWADVTLQLSSVQMELDIRTAQAAGKLGGNLSSVRSTPNDALKALSDHNNDPDAHPNRDEFIEMEDTPGGYTDNGEKFLAVNVGEDGVEFKTISESDISDLDHDADKIKGKSVDAPQAGDDGKALVYDETNDKFAVETVSATGTFEGLSDVPAYSGNAGKVPKVNASEDGVEYEDVATQSELDSHTGDTNNPHSVSKGDVGLGNVENIKHNLTATRDPTISDGSSDGYSVGSKWINVDTDEEFVCLDATSSAAAVWKSTTDQGTGGSDADAIHDNVANEIQPVSEKASPVSADRVLIEDSEDNWNKKSAQLGNLPGGGGLSHSYIGTTTIAGTWESVSDNTIYLQKVTLSSAGVLLSVSVYIKAPSQVIGPLTMSVYEDDSGSPGGLLASNPPGDEDNELFLPDADHWYTMPLGIYLEAGDYWVGVRFPGDTGNAAIDVDTSTGSDETYQASWIRDLTSVSPTATTKTYAIRASVLS
jgi:hypothetical protein